MNKQIGGGTEKRSSSYRRSSLNAAPVSTLRASTAANSAVCKTHRHEVSFGLHEEVAIHSNVPGPTSPSAAAIRSVEAIDMATFPATSQGQGSVSEALPEPPVPIICTSYTHGLSTISEKQSMEDEHLLHPVDGQPSRTNSSCSMPDYLCHKLHSVTVNGQPATQTDTEDHAPSKSTRNTVGPSVAASTIACSSSTSRLVKEPCASSTSTTTSESYQLSDLPPLPAKLATLSKPSSQALLASALRSRKARHSIDVRALPSYLARKRQSTFGQFLTG